MISASILSIGDEVVNGSTIDTNSGFLAELVRSVGIEVAGVLTVVDDPEAIERALCRALEDAPLVLTTGGLGPTADDLTAACVARVAGRDLVLDPESLSRIEARFRERGRTMSENNRKQAMLPAGSRVMPNPLGTAPGFICRVSGDEGRHIASFPGVPHEMRRMARDSLLPWLESLDPGRRFASRVFSTFGLGESRVDELLAGVLAPDEGRLAFRAAFPKVQARITVEGAPGDDLEGRLDSLEARVLERLGTHVYAVGDEGMEVTTGRLLRERGLTLAVAESCTGGLIASRITDVPGSSAYFLLGITAYANEAKQRLLGVGLDTLETHGAVSRETAEEMAEGVRRAADADLGLSTTGIAGPGGGSSDKPVGTVCIALAWSGGIWSRRYTLAPREREWIKGMTAQIALDRVRLWIVEGPESFTRTRDDQ